VDYSFRSYPNALSLSSEAAQALRTECEKVFTGELTFWLGTPSLPGGISPHRHYPPNHSRSLNGAGASDSPRCALESLAKGVFEHHVRRAEFDRARSGVEWWVQVRRAGQRAEDIGMHWDKDEDLVDAQGMNVHPQVSTVTYLSDYGAPTLIVDKAPQEAPPSTPSRRRRPQLAHNAEQPAEVRAGAQVEYDATRLSYGPVRHAWLSLPTPGKHIAFDGRLLHGAPSALATRLGRRGGGGGTAGAATRVTFLANVWLNHRPIGADPFPSEFLQRLAPPPDAAAGGAAAAPRRASRSGTAGELVRRAVGALSLSRQEPVTLLSASASNAAAAAAPRKRARGSGSGAHARVDADAGELCVAFGGSSGRQHLLQLPLGALAETGNDARPGGAAVAQGGSAEISFTPSSGARLCAAP
jgi:hypothetical protein